MRPAGYRYSNPCTSWPHISLNNRQSRRAIHSPFSLLSFVLPLISWNLSFRSWSYFTGMYIVIVEEQSAWSVTFSWGQRFGGDFGLSEGYWTNLAWISLFKMLAILARGQNGVNGVQRFKMRQSLQKVYKITCFIVQNLKRYSLSYLWPSVKPLWPKK